MFLTNQQYMEKFNATDSDASPFQRHLDVCGIKTKNDKKTRAKKFLWGTKLSNAQNLVWISLDQLTFIHLIKIKHYLSNYKHSFEDQQIGWVFDLVDYATENGIYRETEKGAYRD